MTGGCCVAIGRDGFGLSGIEGVTAGANAVAETADGARGGASAEAAAGAVGVVLTLAAGDSAFTGVDSAPPASPLLVWRDLKTITKMSPAAATTTMASAAPTVRAFRPIPIPLLATGEPVSVGEEETRGEEPALSSHVAPGLSYTGGVLGALGTLGIMGRGAAPVICDGEVRGSVVATSLSDSMAARTAFCMLLASGQRAAMS